MVECLILIMNNCNLILYILLSNYFLKQLQLFETMSLTNQTNLKVVVPSLPSITKQSNY